MYILTYVEIFMLVEIFIETSLEYVCTNICGVSVDYPKNIYLWISVEHL